MVNSINFTGHNVEVTDPLKSLTIKKLQRLQQHYDRLRITSIDITFNVENLSQIVEANIRIPGSTIHAKAEAQDMYAAVDFLVGKLDKQLNKHKSKFTEH